MTTAQKAAEKTPSSFPISVNPITKNRSVAEIVSVRDSGSLNKRFSKGVRRMKEQYRSKRKIKNQSSIPNRIDRIMPRMSGFSFRKSITRFYCPPASKYSTAIRTATPFSTWFRISENGPSATSESISIPRLIGPGWSTITSSFASSSRLRFNP